MEWYKRCGYQADFWIRSYRERGGKCGKMRVFRDNVPQDAKRARRGDDWCAKDVADVVCRSRGPMMRDQRTIGE